MSIQKETPSNLRTFGDTYAVIPSSTIDLITNPDALAMLVWLLDRPEDWIIRREHLRTRFGLGRARYDKAMRDLKDAGLAWWHEERDPVTGRIIDRVLNVGAVPLESVLPKVGKPTIGETPTGGKSDHLHITDTLHITNNIHKRFKPPTPKEVNQYAQEKNLTIDPERFCDFYESKGWMVGKNKMKSWQAAARNWNKGKSNGQNGNAGRKNTRGPEVVRAADLLNEGHVING